MRKGPGRYISLYLDSKIQSHRAVPVLPSHEVAERVVPTEGQAGGIIGLALLGVPGR